MYNAEKENNKNWPRTDVDIRIIRKEHEKSL